MENTFAGRKSFREFAKHAGAVSELGISFTYHVPGAITEIMAPVCTQWTISNQREPSSRSHVCFLFIYLFIF